MQPLSLTLWCQYRISYDRSRIYGCFRVTLWSPSEKVIYVCMLHIGTGSYFYISFSLPSNPVPLYSCIYCIMLKSLLINYCLNQNQCVNLAGNKSASASLKHTHTPLCVLGRDRSPVMLTMNGRIDRYTWVHLVKHLWKKTRKSYGLAYMENIATYLAASTSACTI